MFELDCDAIPLKEFYQRKLPACDDIPKLPQQLSCMVIRCSPTIKHKNLINQDL